MSGTLSHLVDYVFIVFMLLQIMGPKGPQIQKNMIYAYQVKAVINGRHFTFNPLVLIIDVKNTEVILSTI